MGYRKAEEILPDELIELIQQYADGVTIYIPKRPEKRAGWGQKNQAKEKIYMRDKNIYRDYHQGNTVPELAKRYYLSEKSIWRILRKMKRDD